MVKLHNLKDDKKLPFTNFVGQNVKCIGMKHFLKIGDIKLDPFTIILRTSGQKTYPSGVW